ncbi:MAG: protein-methionine-sulfoxide reductase heme-binding subunit MsrQ [Chloroflexota bacterium]
MKNKTLGFQPLQTLTHLAALTPLGLMVLDFATQNYGPEPINEFTLRTGKAALVILLLSLACSPIGRVFNYKKLLRLRRPLGLYSFLYASIHFAIFIGVDYFFNFNLIKDALLTKRYAIVGLTTGLILLILAITSTRGWQRRLKANWKRLHRLAYVAGILAVVHFIWLVKPGVSQPWFFAIILTALLLMRIKGFDRWIKSRMSKTPPLQAG